MGSFSSVLLVRLPEGRSICGRSQCQACGHILRWYDLLPVVSFALLRGECRYCRATISWQYIFLELCTASLFLFAFAYETDLLHQTLLALNLWSLFLIAMVDARTQHIPDAFLLTILILAFSYGMVHAHLSLWGVLLAPMFFGSQWALSRGRWVGTGDIALSVAMGAMLGDWQLVLLAVASAYILGAVVAAILLARFAVTRDTRIAFAPFLVMGTFIALLLGDQALSLVAIT